MFLKKIKCPRCGKTAKINLIKGEIITTCTARNPCGYLNKRPAPTKQ